MFHWICPECGREIAPQAKECAACEPSATPIAATQVAAPVVEPVRFELQPEPLLLAAPVVPTVEVSTPDVPTPLVLIEDIPAPLQPRIAGAPKPPASALPLPICPAGRELSPVASTMASAHAPVWQRALPQLEPARAPRISDAPLHQPRPAVPSASLKDLPNLTSGPELVTSPATLPTLSHPEPPAPPLAGFADYAKIALSRIQPARGKAKPVTSDVKEHLSLPGPTLPHELTSLNAAGINKILVPAGQASVAAKGSSWMLSLVVAALVIAGTLGAAFYAMPSLAKAPAAPSAARQEVAKRETKATSEPAKPTVPADPIARIVEVTGIRFVTDLPGRPPEIHYLVVNHSNIPLLGVTVNVTLRDSTSDPQSTLSQFAFRAPRLGPYESKEMVSSIERFNRPVALPDWRELHADVQISQ